VLNEQDPEDLIILDLEYVFEFHSTCTRAMTTVKEATGCEWHSDAWARGGCKIVGTQLIEPTSPLCDIVLLNERTECGIRSEATLPERGITDPFEEGNMISDDMEL
jgi:hypothetical protein